MRLANSGRRCSQLLGVAAASVAFWLPGNASRATTNRPSFATGEIVVAAQQTRLLHPDGTLDQVLSFFEPYSGVIFDSTGNLFAIGRRPVIFRWDADGTPHGWLG